MHTLTRTFGLVVLVALLWAGSFGSTALAATDGDAFATLKAEVENAAMLHGRNIGVYVETDEGVIAVNERTVMSSASIIKVPILLEAIRQAENGDFSWEDEVVVVESDVVAGSGTIKDMTVPKTFTVRELGELMIVVSDNTATNMFMERVGFDEVNWTCIELGCEDIVLQNSLYATMPQDRGPRNWATARDMVRILKGAYETDILSDEGKAEFLRIMRDVNDGRLSEYKDEDVHGDILVARKGGSTANPRVLHDVAIFTLGDQVVYAAALTGDVVPADATATIGEIGESIMNYMLSKQ